ncbi:MAG: tagaturonate reductase, partial [Muribaculaceae bacterium]|nr:tagaturonate reductase [Muribaculaceae bacterium]
MEELNKSTARKQVHPVKVLQFGEGNFIRAFFDWMIEEANHKGVTGASIAVVSPRFKVNDTISTLKHQDGMYHVCLEGIENGEPKQTTTLITSVADAFSPVEEPNKYLTYITSPELRFVVSNTTEAGIRYDSASPVSLYDASSSFPAKITALLYERFRHFEGDPSKGLIFLCCELIEDNGSLLREYVLRYAREAKLGEDFEKWVRESCCFCDTLVDRIVSGFPADSIDKIKEEIGYNDNLVVKGELYHVWAIGGEGTEIVKKELPLDKAGLNVHFLPSVKEFRDKKVRILNGSHTSMVPIALQLGCETVLDAFRNEKVNAFINKMVESEVLP